jgi:diguanylate cyclase (GGDEF)-like protein
MGQVIALSMFRLRPQATMFLGAWTVGWLLAVQGWLVYAQEPGFDGVRALAHVLVSTSGLLAMSLVAMWISAMRSRISSQAKKLRHTLLQAQALATTDGLTGLLNRRRMLAHLDEELAQAAQTRRPVCVAIIDLDHFKRINDWHGHRAGDEVLQGFSAFALRQLRQVDKLARWGGEEFLLLLPHVQHEQARVALERLCQQVAQQPMGEQHHVPITVSVGLAQWTPGEDLACWLDRADRALYEAKQSGRNRCVVAMSPEPVKAQAATSAATPAELMLVREASR